MSKTRQMALVGFLQAQNCSNYVGSWRHPGSATDFLGVEYYQRIAQALEHGKFHMCFFDDRLAMPDILGHSHIEAVRNGVRVVKMDPCTILTCMGMATKNLGLGSTYSTTYYEPFHVARVFATLDHMLGGRAAWNVVTSLNDSEAANFGRDAHPDHDERYDVADEFMEAVLGHWDTWEDDAIVLDKARGVFADPAKVHRLDHRGPSFRTRGPLPVPRTPQGRPVVIQAGQSGRGRRFAARWGELLFVIHPNVEIARQVYREVKEEVARVGRDPKLVTIAPAIYCIPGATTAEAEDKARYIEGLAHPLDTLVLLSEVLNFDFATKGLDEPFTGEELASIGGLQALRDRVVKASGKANPTTRDFITFSGRGTLREIPRFIGTPKTIADGLEEWFTTEACDGFVLAATHVPGAYEEFVALVVPELQRRGLYRTEYEGTTFRERLLGPGQSRLPTGHPGARFRRARAAV
jgi:FMN-dependent oxidoreductase (nitrilotriacetate monooxygenase family)